ncbi:MAG: methyltransferase family protein [Candidatus Acidiferrales bacterium]
MVTSPSYQFIFATLVLTVSYWCWILLEVSLFIRERGTVRSNAEDQGSRRWIIAWLGGGVLLGVFVEPYIFAFSKIEARVALFFVLGIALIWGGMLLRMWSISILGRFFKTTVVIQPGHNLIQRGPYRYLRNPAYTGILITLIGLGLGVGNWLSIASLFFAGLIGLGRRIHVEDEALCKRFGKEYEEYHKRTWAVIPFVW